MHGATMRIINRYVRFDTSHYVTGSAQFRNDLLNMVFPIYSIICMYIYQEI